MNWHRYVVAVTNLNPMNNVIWNSLSEKVYVEGTEPFFLRIKWSTKEDTETQTETSTLNGRSPVSEAPKSQFPKLGQLTDRFGHTIHFGNAGDYWHPPFPIGADSDYRTHARLIREMEIRDEDILVYSFPKTGLHWNREMINQLWAKSSELLPEGKGSVHVDGLPMHVIDAAPSPRLLVTHVPFRYLPKQAFEKKIKFIYLIRNPKDVLVSYYNILHNMAHPFNYAGTFEEFFLLYFESGYYYGAILDHFMDWQNGMKGHPNVPLYTSVFEKIKKDPVGAVEKLNEFLGTGCSKQLCEEIAISCGFKNLKAFKDATMPDKLKKMFKQDATSAFYRKGEVGDWKNWFTIAMNEMFEEEYKKRMEDFDIEFTYTL